MAGGRRGTAKPYWALLRTSAPCCAGRSKASTRLLQARGRARWEGRDGRGSGGGARWEGRFLPIRRVTANREEGGEGEGAEAARCTGLGQAAVRGVRARACVRACVRACSVRACSVRARAHARTRARARVDWAARRRAQGAHRLLSRFSSLLVSSADKPEHTAVGLKAHTGCFPASLHCL